MPEDTRQLNNGELRVDIDGRSYLFDTKSVLNGNLDGFSVEHVRDGLYSILCAGRSIAAVVDRHDANRLEFTVGNATYAIHLVDHRLQLLETYAAEENTENHDSRIRAPMPGLVLKIQVEQGASVAKNDPLLVLEAMKMENEIRAPGDGIVAAIHVVPGEAVSKNAPLIELTPASPTT